MGANPSLEGFPIVISHLVVSQVYVLFNAIPISIACMVQSNFVLFMQQTDQGV